MRGSEARNNLFAVNATSWARRELSPNIDFSPTLVWFPNGQRLAFVSGDTDIYTVNADGSQLTKQFAGDACKAANINSGYTVRDGEWGVGSGLWGNVELLTLTLSFPCNRKRYNFEITWFSNSQKLLFARYCDGFTSDTPGSQSLYTSERHFWH